jgi:murein L,D-transpeptidase YafK
MLFATDLVSQATPIHNIDHQYETMLVNVLGKVKDNQIDNALTDLKHLVTINPKFRLAQLIYADLLLAQAHPITDFGNYSETPYENITALRDEARMRWKHHLSPPVSNQVPDFLLQLSDKEKYIVVVELNASRLYLFQNKDGMPHLLSDFYVTIGKNGIDKFEEGDQKTPTGVYFITGFIDPEELPDLYGDGAYPINYPNIWDKRHGHTGYGIWLHGTPSNTYSRPPRDSDGCVILSNEDLRILSPSLKANVTPVILAKEINWVSTNEWQGRQTEYVQLIEQWRKDWESRDAELYLRHYSKDYSGLGKDYAEWVQYKRRVNPSKRFIKVNITDTSIYSYPGVPGLLVVTFEQDYHSDNFHKRFVKRQYWRKEKDGKWKIIYEGSVS